MPSASPILLRPTPPPPSGPLFSQNHYLRTSLPRLSPSPLNLLTPVECALPRFATSQFVTSIESTLPRKKNHHFADLPAVTPVSTTLTDTAPRNPIRMNTSTKPTRAPSPCPGVTAIYSITYLLLSTRQCLRQGILSRKCNIHKTSRHGAEDPHEGVDQAFR